MVSFKVPPVDPNWDYATQWELIHHMKYLLEDLIVQIDNWDEATKETNGMFHNFLEMLQDDKDKCMNLTDFNTSNSEYDE